MEKHGIRETESQKKKWEEREREEGIQNERIHCPLWLLLAAKERLREKERESEREKGGEETQRDR